MSKDFKQIGDSDSPRIRFLAELVKLPEQQPEQKFQRPRSLRAFLWYFYFHSPAQFGMFGVWEGISFSYCPYIPLANKNKSNISEFVPKVVKQRRESFLFPATAFGRKAIY